MVVVLNDTLEGSLKCTIGTTISQQARIRPNPSISKLAPTGTNSELAKLILVPKNLKTKENVAQIMKMIQGRLTEDQHVVGV